MPKDDDDGTEGWDKDEEEEEEQKWFSAERAKSGRSSCKRCKAKIQCKTLRIAKLAPSPFGSGLMSNWHHPQCFIDSFQKAKATTRRLRCPEEELEGWDDLEEEDRDTIIQLLGDQRVAPKEDIIEGPVAAPGRRPPPSNPDHKDHSFRSFRRLCADVSNTSSYLGKTALVKTLLEKGSEGDGFKGDVYLWFRMLLPMAVKRVYNVHNKQLIKLFSKIFECSMDDMLENLEQGDVSETIRIFFESSTKCPPSSKSKLTLQEVDELLEYLSKLTREEDQIRHFTKIAKKCSPNDLKIIIRLIMHDLKTSAGPKHVLEALHPDAYKAFQTSRDLDAVIQKVLEEKSPPSESQKTTSNKPEKSLGIEIKILTPVLPMLAEVCRSVEYAMKKCPNGMISEIKYDGERVQVHKKGKEFKYFSRSLKPVVPHKVAHFKDYIPKAFPHGEDLILDSEILLMDTQIGKPLPFGTLGVHKKTAFKDACVCLFVFDCLYYNGKSLLNETIAERRKFLLKNMKEIPNRIVFSETKEIHRPSDLETMIAKVLKQGLEGLVLKDLKSTYEPGKRHWLKVKKDYLKDGAMADSADLIVLGAWFGSGTKGGMKSIFLMGCWDPKRQKFCTVTKVHGGHDDETLERLQTELQMTKISKDRSKVPDWLICTKTMVPDFVADNPKESPVWEITGAEFTRHEVHTADGISVRFPRVSAIRTDKTWKEATSLPELQELYKKSKDCSDVAWLLKEKEITDDKTEEIHDGDKDEEENEGRGSGEQEKEHEECESTNVESSHKERKRKHSKKERRSDEEEEGSKEHSKHKKKKHKDYKDMRRESDSGSHGNKEKEENKNINNKDQEGEERNGEPNEICKQNKRKHSDADEVLNESDAVDAKGTDIHLAVKKELLDVYNEDESTVELPDVLMVVGCDEDESSIKQPEKQQSGTAEIPPTSFTGLINTYSTSPLSNLQNRTRDRLDEIHSQIKASESRHVGVGNSQNRTRNRLHEIHSQIKANESRHVGVGNSQNRTRNRLHEIHSQIKASESRHVGVGNSQNRTRDRLDEIHSQINTSHSLHMDVMKFIANKLSSLAALQKEANEIEKKKLKLQIEQMEDQKKVYEIEKEKLIVQKEFVGSQKSMHELYESLIKQSIKNTPLLKHAVVYSLDQQR